MKQERKVEESQEKVQQKVSNPPVISGMRASDYPCKSKGEHKFACITRSCIHYAFLCIDEKCLCQKSHKDCLIVKASCITSNLQKRIISYKPIEDCISQTVDKAIDSLSDHRDKLILSIKSNFESFGLTEWQKQIYKTIKNKQTSDITGHELWELQLSFKSLKINQQIIIEHSLQVKKIFLQVQQQSEGVFGRVKKYLDEIKLKTEKHLVKRQQILKQAYHQIQDGQEYESVKEYIGIFQKSKVVNFSDISRIRNMLKPSEIIFTKLLYRASDYKFSAQAFHQKCDKIENTITVCITQFDKKIGGFTSLTWRPQPKQHNYYKEDKKGSSFIFSLTNNDKFTLYNRNKAIQCHNSYGPCFGQDIQIVHLANSSQLPVKINKDYYNSNYKADNIFSSEKFCGSQSGKFKIKQWEVWYIELD